MKSKLSRVNAKLHARHNEEARQDERVELPVALIACSQVLAVVRELKDDGRQEENDLDPFVPDFACIQRFRTLIFGR